MVLRLARHRIYVVIEMCKIFKREETKNFDLDTAIDYVFGESCTVNKLYNYHTMGTVEVDGVPYDWKMTANSFRFFIAA